MIDVRFRHVWMGAVLADKRLPDGCKLIALALANTINVASGACHPSYETLAKNTNKSRDTAMRAVKRLEAAGWLGIARTKGRKANSFTLLMPSNLAVTPAIGDVEQAVSTVAPREDATVNGRKYTQPLPNNEQSHMAATDANRQQSQIDGSTVAKLCHPEQIEQNPPYSPPVAQQEPTSVDPQFEELWKQWGDGDGKGKARSAFHRAVNALGVSAETILEAAEKQFAERFWDRKTKTKPSLSRWLRDEGWANKPKSAPAEKPSTRRVFVEEGTPAWNEWVAYRQRQGKKIPSETMQLEGRRRGWHFPSEYPPVETPGMAHG